MVKQLQFIKNIIFIYFRLNQIICIIFRVVVHFEIQFIYKIHTALHNVS